MRDSDAIVRPVCNPRSPALGATALMAASEYDLQALQHLLALPDQHRLYMSRIYYKASDRNCPVLAGPMMGAPYASMLLEIMHAWGVRRFVFLGWCGALCGSVRIGDVIVPTGAIIEEGTSPLYQKPAGSTASPHNGLSQAIQNALAQNALPFKPGLVWTTDGVFRETPEKVKRFQAQGALAVEMEMSALFTVAEFHGVELAGVLAVSDELSSLCWRPGFKSPVFAETRARLAEALAAWASGTTGTAS